MCRVTQIQCCKFRISDEKLLRCLNLRTIDDYGTKRQLHWTGQVARMDFDRLPRKMLSRWECTKCPVGAPKYTYCHGL